MAPWLPSMPDGSAAPLRALRRDVGRSLRQHRALLNRPGGLARDHPPAVLRQGGRDETPQAPHHRRLLRGEVRPLARIGDHIVQLIVQGRHERVVERAHVVNELPATLDDRDRAGLQRAEARILLEVHAEDGAIVPRGTRLRAVARAEQRASLPVAGWGHTGQGRQSRGNVRLLRGRRATPAVSLSRQLDDERNMDDLVVEPGSRVRAVTVRETLAVIRRNPDGRVRAEDLEHTLQERSYVGIGIGYGLIVSCLEDVNLRAGEARLDPTPVRLGGRYGPVLLRGIETSEPWSGYRVRRMRRKEVHPEKDRLAAVDALQPVQGRNDRQARVVLQVVRRAVKTRREIVHFLQRRQLGGGAYVSQILRQAVGAESHMANAVGARKLEVLSEALFGRARDRVRRHVAGAIAG